MNLEQILKQIKADTAREVEEILADGSRQVEALLQKAKDEVEGSRQRTVKDAQYRRQRESSIIMRQGIMETLRFQAEARRKLIDAAMQEASEKMDKLYALEGYPEILNRFAQEALSDLAPSLLPGRRQFCALIPRTKTYRWANLRLKGMTAGSPMTLKPEVGALLRARTARWWCSTPSKSASRTACRSCASRCGS